MTTRLSPIEDRVNLLRLSGITLIDLDEVAAWLNACGIAGRQVREACQQVMTDGTYSFSNIEHRVTLFFEH